MRDARTILTQASDKALNQNGELDVSAFVKAREFEIKAMEASMGESKNALSSRAFQQVPNELRRRTASHNVKKVPKRLRNRAAREVSDLQYSNDGPPMDVFGLHVSASVKMKEDNTPTVAARRRKPTPHMRLRLETAKKLQKLHARQKKRRAKAKGRQPNDGTDPEKATAPEPQVRRLKKNALSKPDQPAPKFRKRQKHKCWLPTHVYHAKRAHMTEPKHPLWRFALALSPTEKTFRKTHRASSLRGCVAWDTSYISTIGLEGVEASLLGLLRGIGVGEDVLSGNKWSKWRRGTRSWQGWVRDRDGEKKWIAQVDIIWCIQEDSSPANEYPTLPKQPKQPKQRCFLRVHPSAFLQLWAEILKVAKMQRPSVMVEDLRFEMGSIEVIGPGSTEALIAALQPSTKVGQDSTDDISAKVWSSLGLVTNPSCLPARAILAFNVSDPRLHYPPRKISQPALHAANDELLQTLAAWPPDTAHNPPAIFDRTARLTASRLLPSQKAINRRKGDAMPAEYPTPAPNDPQIPVLLFASRSPTSGAQGSWTLLLPWRCVLPVWYHIMHYPLSTGGNPRFGGLEESRQLAFEQEIPWYPGDFPGTQAGWEWEKRERAKRKADWEKRPKGKRVSWESVDLGKGRTGELGTGWACDWEYLFNPTVATKAADGSQATTTDSSVKDQESSKPQEPAIETPSTTAATLPPSIHHIPFSYAATLLKSSNTLPQNSQALTTIHITLLSRGNPTTCACIYRLPTTSPHLRAQWLALASSILHPPKKQTRNSSPNLDRRTILASLPRNESHPLRTQQTALSLLHPSSTCKVDGLEAGEIIQPGNPGYPSVPDKDDLIGFVTTGNFDLGQGKASAIGSVAVAKVVYQQQHYVSAEAEAMVDNSSKEAGTDEDARRRSGELEKRLGKRTVERLCIVRDAGSGVGRLGRWELA